MGYCVDPQTDTAENNQSHSASAAQVVNAIGQTTNTAGTDMGYIPRNIREKWNSHLMNSCRGLCGMLLHNALTVRNKLLHTGTGSYTMKGMNLTVQTRLHLCVS